MGLRRGSIRLRVIVLVIVPVVSLIGLFGYIAVTNLGNALQQVQAKDFVSETAQPLVRFQADVDTERHDAMLYIAGLSSAKMTGQFGVAAGNTERAFVTLQQHLMSPAVQGNATAQERQAIAAFINDVKGLDYIRNDLAAGGLSMPAALNAYSNVVEAGYHIIDSALSNGVNPQIVTQGLDVIKLDQGLQAALEEGDLLAGAVRQRQFPASYRTEFAGLAARRQYLVSQTAPELLPGYGALLARKTASTAGQVTSLEDAVIATTWTHGDAPPRIRAWSSVVTPYLNASKAALKTIASDLTAEAAGQARSTLIKLILIGLLGLIGIAASIILSIVIGRRLVRQLAELRSSALRLAHEQLPGVISKLRAGEPVDIAAEAPSLGPGGSEIEQVREAFSLVQQTAIQSAVDEARLRRGISDMFRNLAGRSQSLLHRQLTLLDGMERRATEPEELEDLFRIDHLTTRMRRHAEGLIILSGESPARGWRKPVPLVDVLRAAVAEVEDYTRIQVVAKTRAALAGPAVSDVIHLIAELAENATLFSPPNTPVRIQGDVVGFGFAIEVEDRGLGMSPDRLTEINANLADPPQFDLSGSDRLGLFIAGQLAKRHDIRVHLRESVYGGTVAIVLIPQALVVQESDFELAQAALTAGPRGLGRHALAHGSGADFLELPPSAAVYRDDQDTMAPAELASVTGSFLPGPSMVGPSSVFVLDQTAPAANGADDEASGYSGFQFQFQDQAAGAPEISAEIVDADTIEATADEQPADEADGRIAASELASLGLPVRVRQASLAPQLRTAARPAEAEPEAEPPLAEPTPETARNTAAALQRGWQLGRSHTGLGEPPEGFSLDVPAEPGPPAEPAGPPLPRRGESAGGPPPILPRRVAAGPAADGDAAGAEMQDNAVDSESGDAESDEPKYIDSGWSFGSLGNGDHRDD